MQTEIEKARKATKRRQRQRAIISDDPHHGPEPEWSPEVEDAELHLVVCLNWYNVKASKTDLKKWIVAHANKSSNFLDLSTIKSLAKGDIDRHAAIYARLLSRGAPLDDYILDYLDAAMGRMIALGKKKLEKKEEPGRNNSLGVQYYIEEQVADLIAQCGEELDRWTEAVVKKETKGFESDFNIEGFLQINEVKALQTNRMIDYYQEVLSEYEEARAGKDEQLVEAYDFIGGKRQFNKIIKWLQELIDGAEQHAEKMKPARKRRKKKKTPEQKVKDVKYKKKDEKYGLESVSPENIIGADKVILFNTKTCALEILESRKASGLSIKGSTIKNFDENTSMERKIRNTKDLPLDKVLSIVNNGTIRPIKKAFNEQSTKESVPSGRINKHHIIMRTL